MGAIVDGWHKFQKRIGPLVYVVTVLCISYGICVQFSEICNKTQ
jgi:hypothetical protein